MSEIRSRFPGRQELEIEIGNYMQRFGPDRAIKNKWVLQGMKQLGLEVLNVAEDDIDELMAQGIDLQNDERFISANLISLKTSAPLLRPYVIKQLAVRGSERKFRVGFLGLSSKDSFYKTEDKGYFWDNPYESAKKWIPEVRQKCDFLIVVACMASKDAVQLAVDNKDIDIILTGFKHQWNAPPAKINQSTIIYAEEEGKILGELRFRVIRGEKVDVSPFNHNLTKAVKDDPEMAAFVARAKEEITSQQRALANAPVPQTNAPVSQARSPFLTARACVACHAAAYETWQRSKHAHAIEILRVVHREFDSACVKCHTTGMGKTGGFEDLNKTPEMANVQCEACHGPGQLHSLKPSESKLGKLDSSSCVQCHTHSNSPEFNFVEYWSKIKH